MTRYYVSPDGMDLATREDDAEVPTTADGVAFNEVDEAGFYAAREAADAALQDRLQARGEEVAEARAADAATVYDGAIGSGLPESVAVILARQVDPTFETSPGEMSP